jgi:dolichyl-phosphooligosaccharide-protein glycotransferase
MDDDKPETSGDGKEEELQVDFTRVKNFFSSMKKPFSNTKRNIVLATILLILIPVALTFYIRLMPADLPQTDTWAQNAVDNYFKNQIAGSINSQYPNLPSQNKQSLIDQQYSEFIKSNKANVDQQIKDTSQFFKAGFRYEENNHSYTFLGDLDSYYYLRQARNLEKTGTACDVIRDGKCIDTFVLAPIGSETGIYLHPYGIVYLHKILHFFNKTINLMTTSFLLPTFLAAIAAIAAFFIGRRLMNEVAGFFAAMLVALSPMLVTRTLGSDTDIWNIVLPLLIVWMFVEAFEANSFLKKSIFATLSGFFMGLFAFAWGGWWYIFDFIMVSAFAYFVIILVKNYITHKNITKAFTEDVRSNLLTIAVLILSTIIFVTIFFSFASITAVFTAPLSTFTTLKAAAKADLWPNVYTTVAELNEASLSTIVSQVAFGINWLFTLALLGIVLSMTNKSPRLRDYLLIAGSIVIFLYLTSASAFSLSPYAYVAILMLPVAAALLLFLIDRHSSVDIKPALLFTLWFVGMIIASIKGVRFILLLTPVFAIAVGVAAGYIFQFLSRVVKRELKINETVSNIAVFIVVCMLLILPFKAGISAGESFTPSMTKGWWDSLTKINVESKPDAIINSWWDFGHWFKYVAERRVSLDGVTQNHPNAHWLGLILQTDDERRALGILRMLDCGSNNAFDEVNKKFNDTEISENIVSNMIVKDKTEGGEYLKTLGYTNEEIRTISNYTYCNPPEDYFITSEDMVGKAGVWAHFGLWNFDKAYMVNNIRKKSLDEGVSILESRFNLSSDQSAATYYDLQSLQSDQEMNSWISAWPNYFTQNWVGCTERNQTINTTEPVLQTKTEPDSTVNASNSTDNATADANPPVSYIVVSKAVNRTMLCGINSVIGQDANGKTVIEGAIFSFDNPTESRLVISSYDNNGMKRGSGTASPSSFVVMNRDKIERVIMENSSFSMDVIIDTVNNRLLITDPQLSGSMFTKLFFLDGRYTTQFEKFSDITDITGVRIIVWKVKWPESW